MALVQEKGVSSDITSATLAQSKGGSFLDTLPGQNRK